MTPFLLCMFGPQKGTRIPLTKESTILGRDRTNAVYISDLLLSRKHCCIQKGSNGYTILDLQSRNGVFVNGIPIHERGLEHGDRIEIGGSTFLFLDREEDSLPADVTAIDDAPQGGTTLSLKVDDSIFLKESAPEKALSLLLRITRTLNSTSNLAAFHEKLLELLFELTPCDEAAVLEIETNRRMASRSRQIQQPAHKPSKSICEQVIRQKIAILAFDFQLPESLTGTEVRSVLCVPLLWRDRILSLLYMDTIDPLGNLQESHLQIASAIAAFAVPSLYQFQEMDRLHSQNRELQEEARGKSLIIGESPAVRKVLDLISRVGPSGTTVLIRGESGTGKELAAKAIHAASARADQVFVPLNCAAIPETLLESELFGYEKGAFTGAIGLKKGKIEAADGGTLFLDEIGELAPALQAKLLRVLQEREFERVGGVRSIPVDIRVIAATNQDLEKAIVDGKFRKDLYYRLNVVTLTMPPLRELGGDLILLAQHFISQFVRDIGRRVHGLSPEAKECLLKYDWPGNVRELQNAMERAVALGTSEWILPEDLPDCMMDSRSTQSDEKSVLYQDELIKVKRGLVLNAFKGTKGNYNEAAARLGVHPNYLYRLVKNLNIKDQI